jgi:hypothetical protein
MKRVLRLPMGAFSLILGCCSLLACQPMGLNQAHGPLSALSPSLQSLPDNLQKTVQNYLFQLQSGFQIAAVDAGDAPVIEPVRQQFEADLKAGKFDIYQQNKDFSIQLLAGSEGNYFTSPELVQALNERVLATLVVMLPDQKTAVFKGEFENQRFYFADPSQELALASASKAYLMTADANFAIQTYKGEILPESQTETQTAAQTDVPVSPNTAAASETFVPDGAHFEEEQAEAWEAEQHSGVYRDPFAGDYPQVRQAQPAYPVSGFAYAGGDDFSGNQPRYLPSVAAWAGKVEKVENKYQNKFAYKYEAGYIQTRIGQAAVPAPPLPQPGPVNRAVRANGNFVPQPPSPPRARPVYRIEAQFQVEGRAVQAPSVVYQEPFFQQAQEPPIRQAQEPGQSRPLPHPQP